MSTPRAYFSLQAVNGAILAVGGVSNNGYTGGVEVFNPDASYWIQNVPEDFGLQTPRSAFATVFIQNKTESELKLVEIELPLVEGGVNIELPIDPTTTTTPPLAKQGSQYHLIPNAVTNMTITHFNDFQRKTSIALKPHGSSFNQVGCIPRYC